MLSDKLEAMQGDRYSRCTSSQSGGSGYCDRGMHESGQPQAEASERLTTIERKIDVIADRVGELCSSRVVDYAHHTFRAEFDPAPLAELLDDLSSQYATKTIAAFKAAAGRSGGDNEQSQLRMGDVEFL